MRAPRFALLLCCAVTLARAVVVVCDSITMSACATMVGSVGAGVSEVQVRDCVGDVNDLFRSPQLNAVPSLIRMSIENSAVTGLLDSSVPGPLHYNWGGSLEILELSDLPNLASTTLGSFLTQTFLNGNSLKVLELVNLPSFTGNFPSLLGVAPVLERLVVVECPNFSGPVPSTLQISNTVKVLDLRFNQFDLGLSSLNFPSSLEELYLMKVSGDLKFSDPNYVNPTGTNNFFPNSVFSLSDLKILSMTDVGLEGPFPTSFQGLSSLEELYLDYNLLEGKVSSQALISMSPVLHTLWLNDNELKSFGDQNYTTLDDISTLFLENRWEQIKLGNNPIECVCTLTDWIGVVAAQTMSVVTGLAVFTDWGDVKCDDSNDLVGQSVYSLRPDAQAPCQNPLSPSLSVLKSDKVRVDFSTFEDLNEEVPFEPIYQVGVAEYSLEGQQGELTWKWWTVPRGQYSIDLWDDRDLIAPSLLLVTKMRVGYKYYDGIMEYEPSSPLRNPSSPDDKSWSVRNLTPEEWFDDFETSNLLFERLALEAQTRIVWGPGSKNSQIWMWDDAPEGALTDFEVKLATPHFVEFSFKGPANENSRLSTLEFSCGLVGVGFEERVNSTSRQIKIENLEPSFSYTVDCFAFNEHGRSQDSATFTFSTADGCPAGQKAINPEGTECLPCDRDSFNDQIGSSSCQACPSTRPFTVATGAASDDDCVPDFGFVEMDGQIVRCPVGLDCSQVGTTVQTAVAEPGYWRASPDSLEVFECPEPAYCVRKNDARRMLSAGDEICAEFHTGALCYGCVEGFAVDSAEVGCQSCDDIRGNQVTRLSSALIVMSFIVFSIPIVVVQVRTAAKRQLAKYGDVAVSADGGGDDKKFLSGSRRGNSFLQALATATKREHFHPVFVVIEIVLSFFQILAVYADAFSNQFPETFVRVASSLSLFRLDFAFIAGNSECLWNINRFYFNLLATSTLPLLMGAVLWLSGKIIHRKYPQEHSVARAILFNLFLLILFLVYPSVSNAAFGVFRCQTYDDGSTALLADPSVQCVEDPFRTGWLIIATVVVIIYPVGVVVFFGALLFKHRASFKERIESKKHANDSETDYLLFLFEPYKNESYAWECASLLIKLCQAVIPSLILPDSVFGVVVAAAINEGARNLYAHYKPFYGSAENWLMIYSQGTLVFVCFGAVVADTSVFQELSDAVKAERALSGVMIFSVGSVVLLALLFIVGKVRIGPVRRMLKEAFGSD